MGTNFRGDWIDMSLRLCPGSDLLNATDALDVMEDENLSELSTSNQVDKKHVVSEENFRKGIEAAGQAQEPPTSDVTALQNLFEEGPQDGPGETVEKSEDMMQLDDIETVDTFLLGLVPFEFFLSDFKKSYAIEPFVEKEMRQAAKLAFEALPSEEKTKFESKAKEHLAAMERQANAPPAASLTDMCCGARQQNTSYLGLRSGTDEVLSS